MSGRRQTDIERQTQTDKKKITTLFLDTFPESEHCPRTFAFKNSGSREKGGDSCRKTRENAARKEARKEGRRTRLTHSFSWTRGKSCLSTCICLMTPTLMFQRFAIVVSRSKSLAHCLAGVLVAPRIGLLSRCLSYYLISVDEKVRMTRRMN